MDSESCRSPVRTRPPLLRGCPPPPPTADSPSGADSAPPVPDWSVHRWADLRRDQPAAPSSGSSGSTALTPGTTPPGYAPHPPAQSVAGETPAGTPAVSCVALVASGLLLPQRVKCPQERVNSIPRLADR